MRTNLSVVVLNYNRKKDVLELLGSLEKQDYRDFETILVDNASSDGTADEISETYPDLKIVALNKNIGRAGHNEGAKEARGDILVFLDADTYLPKNFLRKIAKKFRNKKINAISFFMKDPSGKTYGWEPTYSAEGDRNEGYESTFGGGMWAIRRQIFEKVGPFNPDFFVYVDEWEYLIRLWKKGYSVRYFPKEIIGYHKESPYAYRSVMKGYHVIVNHAQIYGLYLPIKLWPRFWLHHGAESVKILTTGEAERWGTVKGLALALPHFLKALPKRKVLKGTALKKFLRFYFPKRGDVVVGKWGWKL